MSYQIKAPKKLIEVALPLDAINAEAGREKSIRHGHPSTLHLWWARRPLAAARAVIFGQMVNDPSWKWEMENPGAVPPNHLKASWAKSRNRLFSILRDLVLWDSTADQGILEKARAEIRKSWIETCDLNKAHPQAESLFDPDKLPGLHDPFAGGGAIPLEAQRLGLASFASDLNPVAVLINKAMIEIPPVFAGRAPVGPITDNRNSYRLDLDHKWIGTAGLAEDVRRYGSWICEEARKRIGHLYPPVEITSEMAKIRADLKPLIGQKLNVIAWIWARTVKSPNPAFRHVDVPLVSTFFLTAKAGNEAYVEPIIDGDGYEFVVQTGTPADIETAKDGTVKRSGATCIMSNTPIPFSYLRDEAKAGRMGTRLLAIAVESDRGRIYLSPSKAAEDVALSAKPQWKPDAPICHWPGRTNVVEYGMTTFGDLFTPRQLNALNTFSDLIGEARIQIEKDALIAGMSDHLNGLNDAGNGAKAYAEAVSVFLAFAVDYAANYWSVIATPADGFIRGTFSRQALPMTWDFAEAPPFGSTSGNWMGGIDWIAKSVELLPGRGFGEARMADAAQQDISTGKVVSTDPPYYDNIGYADLSDFFYVWLRRSLRSVFSDLFATIAVPKAEELVATPYRHGSKKNAENFFLSGMTEAMHRLAEAAHPSFPVTIYYAFKQSETNSVDGTNSTGWETFLEAVMKAGFALTGTWPMRTERGARAIGINSNALASSIILVCRPRASTAITISRRAFIRELNQILPEALDEMTRGSGDERSPVAPVDLSQAIIGPGMAVFSKYTAVLEADGSPMTVQAALRLINRFLAEDDFDADTQFCLHWFEQYGWREGRFGDADTLARAKGTAVDGVKQAGVIHSASGIVRLLKWAEYPADWKPETDPRLPVWEVLHQLVRVVRTDGEGGAGALLASVAMKAEATRQLAYRLYTLCERAGWAEDARAYNELITSWSAIESAAIKVAGPKQASLFDQA